MQKYWSQMPKKRLYCGVAAVVLGVAAAGGIVWNLKNQPQVVEEELPTARTLVVGAKKEAQSYAYAGEVRGRYESKLAFQVNGKIVKRNVQLGSAVQAGDVLLQIDPKDVQQTVSSMNAQVASAQSQLRLAEKNRERYQRLCQNGAVSQMVYDQYVTAYDAALAAVQQAEAQQTQSGNQMEYTLLRADHAGVVSELTAEIGQVVSAGQPIATVIQNGEREIEISVPENRLEELNQAGTVQVTFWALANRVIAGTVREVAPMADLVTRTFKVRVALNQTPPEVKLGMTASVTVGQGNSQQVLTVPLAAIYQNGSQPGLWVVQADGTLSLRMVKLGQYGSDSVQVVEGLQPGERIIAAGVHKFREGQRISLGGGTL